MLLQRRYSNGIGIHSHHCLQSCDGLAYQESGPAEILNCHLRWSFRHCTGQAFRPNRDIAYKKLVAYALYVARGFEAPDEYMLGLATGGALVHTKRILACNALKQEVAPGMSAQVLQVGCMQAQTASLIAQAPRKPQ